MSSELSEVGMMTRIGPREREMKQNSLEEKIEGK